MQDQLLNKVTDKFEYSFDKDGKVAIREKQESQIVTSVSELSKEKKQEQTVRNLNKTGRNEKCPCGSGKKYKKCHLYEEQGFKLDPKTKVWTHPEKKEIIRDPQEREKLQYAPNTITNPLADKPKYSIASKEDDLLA